jgi:hypothetical protein
VTWILLLATFGVLGSIAVACRRAHLEADAQLCDPLQVLDDSTPVGAPRGTGLLVLSGEGGAHGESDTSSELIPARSRRHLRLVG